MTRRDMLVGCVRAMVAGKKPPASCASSILENAARHADKHLADAIK